MRSQGCQRRASCRPPANVAVERPPRSEATREPQAREARLRRSARTRGWASEPPRTPTKVATVLRGPIRATYKDGDAWDLFGVASFGGIIKRIWSLGESPAEQAQDAELEEFYYGSGPDSAEVTGTSALSRPMCPRGDSNTRHAV